MAAMQECWKSIGEDFRFMSPESLGKFLTGVLVMCVLMSHAFFLYL